MRLLLIEDDKKIRQFITKGLQEEGHSVTSLDDGNKGLAEALGGEYEIIILDRMLPGMDGLALCRAYRKAGRATPLIMLTAVDAVESRVEGLDAGADDYLVKPFAFSELLARLRSLGRRPDLKGSLTVEVDGLSMDLMGHRAHYKGKHMDLTSREFSLLQLFMKRKGQVLSRTIIIESVWGYDFESETNVIDVYVNYLRNKLTKLTGKDWIKTIRHRGYSFEAPG